MVDESEIVMAALDGMHEDEEVCLQFGIMLEQLDEIMTAHSYKKCVKCQGWHNGKLPICEDC